MEEDKQYKNPTPVAVAIIPVEKEVVYNVNGVDYVLTIHQAVYGRRNIEPKLGMLALPGGFVNELERLETGGKREIKEETGLVITEDEFQLFRSEITPNNRNLVFGITPTRSLNVLAELEHNWKNDAQIREETQGFVIAGLNVPDSAFPLHQKALGKYLDKVNGEAIQQLLSQNNNHISLDDKEQLVNHLKKDGYLSLEYEYKQKNIPRNKF